MKLPSPRFELRWNKTGEDWKDSECVYSFVFPLGEYDIRRGDEEPKRDEIALEIGKTKCNGGDGKRPIESDGKVRTPYRDGAHAHWDQQAIGTHIPIIAVCEDVFTVIEPRTKPQDVGEQVIVETRLL